MDLRPFHIRYGQTQFYHFPGDPAAPRSDAILLQTYQHAHQGKNRSQNCLTVSNLKLDDVFSDIFGNSYRSIANYILDHLDETFDISPFVDPRCKTPVSEIQATVDGTISPEQAVKLRQCHLHIDELELIEKKSNQKFCRSQNISLPF